MTEQTPPARLDRRRLLGLGATLPLAASLPAGCGWDRDDAETDLSILADHELQPFDGLIRRIAAESGFSVEIAYAQPGGIVTALAVAEPAIDAVWLGSRAWLPLVDPEGRLTETRPAAASPIVLGVRRSRAEALGWIGRDVATGDLLAAVENDGLRLIMPNAAQTAPGTDAMLGTLAAFAGRPGPLGAPDLDRPEVRDAAARLFRRVERTSGDAAWLRSVVWARHERYDAMLNTEATLIVTNVGLASSDREPLLAFYPSDAPARSESVIGFLDRGDADRRERYARLVSGLAAEGARAETFGRGWRPGDYQGGATGADTSAFDGAWGVSLDLGNASPPAPEGATIRAALDLYRAELRPPSITALCLDSSGSMEGDGKRRLLDALGSLLRPDAAASAMLRPAAGDVTILIPFNTAAGAPIFIRGDDPAGADAALAELDATAPAGGTNLVDASIEALRAIEREGVGGRLPAIVLATDGQGNVGEMETLRRAFRDSPIGGDVPVYATMFGDALEDELTRITGATAGRLFDGRDDLFDAIRTAMTYN